MVNCERINVKQRKILPFYNFKEKKQEGGNGRDSGLITAVVEETKGIILCDYVLEEKPWPATPL